MLRLHGSGTSRCKPVASRSLMVASAGQKPLLVVSGQYRSMPLLHFAAAPLRMSLTLNPATALVPDDLDSPLPAPIASRQSEQLPKSNEKNLPLGLMCSMTFTIPKTPPVAVRMTNLSVLVKTIPASASGSVVLPPNQLAPLIE